MLDSVHTTPGTPNPLGLSSLGGQWNFALFSQHATRVILGLFTSNSPLPQKEYPLFRSGGDIWHICLSHLPPGCYYAYRIEGAHEDATQWMIDPYAKYPATSNQWGKKTSLHAAHIRIPSPFDWEGDTPPNLPKQDLILYEMHVRGFTRHPSSRTAHPGTFLSLIEKIDHLKELGINAIELMPLFEFEEGHSANKHPDTGEPLYNYWGYDPIFFFAPMRRYTTLDDPTLEFKMMVKALHQAGIEVILDVVFNHTGEGKDPAYRVSFRGIDRSTYYMLNEKGEDRNFTGCGNTFNVNHPVVQDLILHSLRYWVEEMHVDGFRFDLASIFTRGVQGEVLSAPPILHRIQNDPILQKIKLIAEPWDAAGLYQIGQFAQRGPWSEWNGPFRDHVRRFLKGNHNEAGAFANALCGSEAEYHPSQTVTSSVNFITAHDGFTLSDLVSYNHKANLANGEHNQDGANHNDSWNGGVEGETKDPKILALREKQMRNFFLALLVSQGIPMLLMGDEYGHTRHGNNNPYVQDNELNWFLWDQCEHRRYIVHFLSALIHFRKNHALLRNPHFLTSANIDWHGMQPFQPNFSSKLVAYTLKKKGTHSLYLAFNADNHPVCLTLPPGAPWHRVVHTALPWEEHQLLNPLQGPLLPAHIALDPHSACLAQSNL